MNRAHLFSVGLGSAALLMAGAATAATPPGHFFNNWVAADGRVILQPDAAEVNAVTDVADFADVTSQCLPPACVVLLNEVGMLQARIRANDDPDAMGYFQTINVQDGFSGLPSASDFRNESFVQATNGGFPMAALNYVELDAGDFMQARIQTGALQIDEPMLEVYQSQSAGMGGWEIDFWLESRAASGTGYATGANGGTLLRIDQFAVNGGGGNRFTPVTIRQASGFYTQDTTDNELAVVGSDPITFNAGDHIGTIFMAGQLWHLGFHHTGNQGANRQFEVHNVSNFTQGTSAAWTSTNNTIDDTGIGYVNFNAAWTDDFWNENVFGTAPDATNPFAPVFPDQPDHPDLLFTF